MELSYRPMGMYCLYVGDRQFRRTLTTWSSAFVGWLFGCRMTDVVHRRAVGPISSLGRPFTTTAVELLKEADHARIAQFTLKGGQAYRSNLFRGSLHGHTPPLHPPWS